MKTPNFAIYIVALLIINMIPVDATDFYNEPIYESETYIIHLTHQLMHSKWQIDEQPVNLPTENPQH